MRIKETKVYQFSELSEEAKAKALDKCRHWNVDDSFWYESIIDDVKDIGKILGIDIDNIYFSGFSNQGDGACFEGRYTYAKGAAKAIRAHAPKDETLHGIADALQAIQRKRFYSLYADTQQQGRYYHMNVDVRSERSVEYNNAADEEATDAITDALTDFAQWIYKSLETEYEYMTSDEAIAESFEANECEFTEAGERVECQDNRNRI